MRSQGWVGFVSAGILLGLWSGWGCESAPPPEEGAAAAAVIVEGWSCANVSECFGLEVGRARVYTRTVGKNSEVETWFIADVFAGEDGTEIFIQDGGPEYYEVGSRTLGVAMRGELVPMLVMPVGPESAHLVQSQRGGGSIAMRVLRFEETVTTPAGSFTGCFVHEARFENPESPTGSGLVVETTYCEGVGEVRQHLVLPGLPLPVTIELNALDALVTAAR